MGVHHTVTVSCRVLCVCSICDSVSVIELLDNYKATAVLCLFLGVCVLSVTASLLFDCYLTLSFNC